MYGIRDYSAKRRPVGVFEKIMLGVLELCAVLLLEQSILLSVFGVNTNAVLCNVEQQNYRFADDRYDPTRFELSCHYTVSGETMRANPRCILNMAMSPKWELTAKIYRKQRWCSISRQFPDAEMSCRFRAVDTIRIL